MTGIEKERRKLKVRLRLASIELSDILMALYIENFPLPSTLIDGIMDYSSSLSRFIHWKSHFENSNYVDTAFQRKEFRKRMEQAYRKSAYSLAERYWELSQIKNIPLPADADERLDKYADIRMKLEKGIYETVEPKGGIH